MGTLVHVEHLFRLFVNQEEWLSVLSCDVIYHVLICRLVIDGLALIELELGRAPRHVLRVVLIEPNHLLLLELVL